MDIALITPAGAGSRAGNRATATRWARFLRGLGHRVAVDVDYDGHRADLMIALHAWRSAAAIRRFAAARAEAPLVVVLTGTDIYRFQHTHPDTTRDSMARADVLVGLHDRVAGDIPAEFRPKLCTVLQSAVPLARRAPAQRHFDVCVVGHLRDEKDSLRAALAVRDVPAASRLRVLQAGRAHNGDWEAAAHAEMAANPRYHWRGEIAHSEVRRLMARARLMVMSSRMEGGANVVAEACMAGLPIVASDIPGNRGMLGDDYPGYYPVADTVALREMLLRAERDAAFLGALGEACRAQAPRFRPECERAALADVIARACATNRSIANSARVL
ncbi:MAG TPA: selenoneine biosynthesis selenosugar synthase SenB [Rhodocyclaceae bacterium]|nr:selenoneine biosynthesis selenosugar synthase SenB [Rhodocyclaceae bacterium]